MARDGQGRDAFGCDAIMCLLTPPHGDSCVTLGGGGGAPWLQEDKEEGCPLMLVDLMVAMLSAAETIQMQRGRRQQRERERGIPSALEINDGPLPSPSSVLLPVQPPYLGYRGDLLCVLSNAAFGRPLVAERIADLPGAVELLLAQVVSANTRSMWLRCDICQRFVSRPGLLPPLCSGSTGRDQPCGPGVGAVGSAQRVCGQRQGTGSDPGSGGARRAVASIKVGGSTYPPSLFSRWCQLCRRPTWLRWD